MPEPIREAQIRQMVEDFYGRVREDPVLGPVFEGRLAGRWPAHLDKMVDFWASALLSAGRYSGNPRATHAAVPGISPAHFQRWLGLFEETLARTFEPPVAASILGRARTMAQALSRGLHNTQPGLPLTETASETPSETPKDRHP